MDSQSQKQFLQQKVNPILEKLVTQLLKSKPDNITEFMVTWLQQHGRKIELGNKQKHNSSDESDEDDTVAELLDKKQLVDLKKNKQCRTSVSAEAYGAFNKKGNFVPKVV